MFDTFVANAGTYEFDGTTVTRQAQVAKDQALIGRTVASQITVTANRFVDTQSDGPNMGRKFTYERVE